MHFDVEITVGHQTEKIRLSNYPEVSINMRLSYLVDEMITLAGRTGAASVSFKITKRPPDGAEARKGGARAARLESNRPR